MQNKGFGYRFLFKNSIILTFFAFNELRLLLANCPAFEKILSAGTDVATTAKYFLASLLRDGNVCSLFFHQSSGSYTQRTGLSSVYLRISIRAWVPVVRCCWDARTLAWNSSHIPPFAAGGDEAAPPDELEVVSGVGAEQMGQMGFFYVYIKW